MNRRPLVAGRHVVVTGDPADQYFTRLADDEEWTDDVLPLLLQLVGPDDVVVEVGANIGLHTLALSQAAPRGHVYAFEPATRTVGHLRQNVDANQARNVTVVQSAVGDVSGTIELYVNREFAAGSLVVQRASPVLRAHLETAASAHGPQPDDPTTTPWGEFETVPVVRLDDFTRGMARVDLVKIDTEGHDMQVLSGAAEMLARLRPAVMMEFSSLALTLHQSTLPADALARIRQTFDHVFVVEPEGRHWAIRSDTDAWKLLEANATVRPVHDLLCLFDDSPARDRVEERGLETPPPVPLAEPDEDGTSLAAKEAETRSTDVALEVERLRAELAAMRDTLSWRLTEPLRRLRARMRR